MTAAAKAGPVEPPPVAAALPITVLPLQLPPIVLPTANPDDTAWEGLGTEDSGDLVTSAEKGWVYTWIRPADYPPTSVQIQHERQKLINRGWEPCSGPLYVGAPRAEYVANRPELEIWRVTQKRYDNEWLVDMARSVLDRRYADRHFRWCEKGSRKGLPANIAEAMYAFHGLMKIPGRPTPPTRDQMIALVRRMPVHPGTTQRQDTWD